MPTERQNIVETIGYGLACESVEEFVSRWTFWFTGCAENYKSAFSDVMENPPEFDAASPFNQEDWDFEAGDCLGGFGSVYPQEYLPLFEKLLKRQRTRSIALHSLWDVSYVKRLPILPLLRNLVDDSDQVNEEEFLTLIDAIGCCTGKDGLEFLQQFREKISLEREIFIERIDSYLAEPK